MKTDVLFIHRQLAFAVSIKQALERTGNYDVHPFTSVEAAMEYLRGHPQDVALVDFMMPVYSGEEIVERLRQAQPQVTVVATPTQTEDEFARLDLQGMLPAAFTAREFIPVVERALEGRRTGELPPAGPKPSLLDRVQPDFPDEAARGTSRPPTSVIGYRSLESILDENTAPRPPAPDEPTLVQGLPVAPRPEADDAPESMPDSATLLEALPVTPPEDDLSFLDDVVPLPTGTQPLDLPPPEPRIETERLANPGSSSTDDLPPLPPVDTDRLKVVTEPLPDSSSEAAAPIEGIFAGFDPAAYGAEYGTRPLSELDAEEAAAHLGPAPAQSLTEALQGGAPFGAPSLAGDDEDEESANYEAFSQDASAFPPALDQSLFADADPFAEPDTDSGEQPVDYMAYLNLTPAAPAVPADAPPWLTDSPGTPAPAPADDAVYAGLEALFSGGDEAPPANNAPAREEYTFEDLLSSAPAEDEFAGVLGEIGAGEFAQRERSEFDDLVASMSAQDQRPPLPTRQQQYVDVSLTDDMSSLLEQIEQARTGGEAEPAEADYSLASAPIDLSNVLFDDDGIIGGDTPATTTGGDVFEEEESPALASSEELAALFGAAHRDSSSASSDPDLEALVATDVELPQAEPDYGDAFADLPAETDFEALFATELEAPAAPPAEFVRDIGTANPASTADAELEALFAEMQSAVAAEPDFDEMFGGPAVPGTAPLNDELDVFGGDWDASDLVDIEQGPRFEETGTVSDLMTGVNEVTGGSGRSGMLTRLDGDGLPVAPEKPTRASADTMPAPLPAIDDSVTALLAEIEMQLAATPPPAADIDRTSTDDSGDTPARRILETTSDAEQTDSSFSVNSLIENIEAQLPPNQAKVQPLPSWLRTPPPPPAYLPEAPVEDITLVHSPALMDEMIPHAAESAVEGEPPFDWDSATFDETTAMGSAARVVQMEPTGDEETSWLEFIEPESPAEETLVAGAAAMAGAAEGTSALAEPDWEAVDAEAEAAARAMQSDHIDDPYIAQLALSLTDVSLELTADAVLLTRGRDIAAFAGRMSRDELIELRQVIDDDWEAAASDARIRFLRLPESGKDVMLYSRRTVEDLTLSLVFDGAMPLRDIRQQGKRLTEALAAVPETPVELVLPPPMDDEVSADEALSTPRSPHAFVWLLRDPNGMLARPVAQAIISGINQQLHEHGWRVREMRASEDHVYLLADSPDEQPPYVAVRELMRRSAQIAHVQNPALDARSLWADAYLVVTPGRSLDQDEIQQFIQFERML